VLEDPLPADVTGRDGDRPYVAFDQPRQTVTISGERLPGRMLIVAGRDERGPETAQRIDRFASQARIPVLADPLSGARRGPAAIAHYDLLLRNPRFADAHRPHLVIRTGDLPTSKPLRQWLASLDAAQIAVDPENAWHDPDAVVGLRLAGFPDGEVEPTDPDWLASWRAADDAAERVIETALAQTLSEPLVARRLGEWLSPASILFAASSMPIRDLESFLAVRSDAPRVLANRGANGIDGTVSAAFGAAAATDEPVVLLIGDVALAHDLGGLLAARRLGLALTIVLLNNDGGGIFHFLAVSGQSDAFEEHVATPHGLDFAKAAELYGCGYELATNEPQLHDLLDRSVEGPGTTVIEIRTNREENLALHRQTAEAVAAALPLSRQAAAAEPEA
jgi:2-succinyl-5-enolpyruvyl-6-hydroxy-3-cyclohexene-1-carboxylate synthase